MKQIKTCFNLFAVVFVLLQLSCNDTATTSEQTDKDTTSVTPDTDVAAMPPYDPGMDPYNVGGQSIKKMGDSLGIKMYELTVKPGDSAALHSHPDHAVYVLQGGKLDVTFKGAPMQVMDLKTGSGFISGAVSDAIKNTGKTTVKLLLVDIHRPRAK